MKKKRLMICLLSAFCLMGAGYVHGWAADVIKIGLTISETGKYEFASSQGFKGVKIWADTVNERGGLTLNQKKVPVQLICYDDKSDKDTAAKRYEKLINQDKADICFAPFGSTLTGAVAPVTEKYGKMLVIWSAASDAIYEQGYKNIVSATETPVSLMPRTEIEHIASLGIQSIAIIFVDEPFPAGLARHAKRIAAQYGIEVKMYETFSPDTKDFTALLKKAKEINAEAFYPSAYMKTQKLILQQMKAANLMFPYVYMVYSGIPEWLELGDDGLYMFGHTLYHENLDWPVNAGLSRADFEKVFRKKFPNAENPPDFQTSLAYGACVLLEKYIETANSLEAKALKKAALALSGKMVVMTGPYEIDETGKQLQMPMIVTQAQKINGKPQLVLLYPEEVATGDIVYPIPGWDKR